MINHKNAYAAQIKISTDFQIHLPNIFADKILIKQLLVSLIARSVELSPKNSEIKIFTSSLTNNGTSFIQIIIKDSALALSNEDISKIQARVGGWDDNSNLNDCTEVDFKVIHEILKQHDGIIEINPKTGEAGNEIIITLPISNVNYKNNYQY
jgi:two-component system cell cycle sensor histidine kinase PleC